MQSERAQEPLADWRDAVLDSPLKANPKLVALALSTFMDRKGVAFPGKATLAKKTSLCKRTVDGAIESLILSGFCPRQRQPRGRTSNRYGARFPTVQHMQVSEGSNRATDDTQPCSSRHPTVQHVHPKAVESSRESANGVCRNCKSNPIANEDAVLCVGCIAAQPKRVPRAA